MNRLLGLDDQKEVALAIIDVPGGKWISEKYKGPIPTLPEPMLQASRVSAKEIDYPAVREMPSGWHSRRQFKSRNGDDP